MNIDLRQGDCLELMKSIQDGSVDLTVTSPPYDNLRTYNGFSWDFKGVAKELYRITKNGGVVVWIVGDATVKGSETGTSFRQALYFMECGFNLHDTMIYGKGKPWDGHTSKDVRRLLSIPSDDVAPVRHGKWVHSRYENCSEQFEMVKCSCCGREAYAMSFYVRDGNYCPNCGAEMDGGEVTWTH